MSRGDQWPAEIESEYEKVDPLGSGAFGTVWMVKKKQSADPAADEENDDDYFAIKGIDIGKKNSRAYAEREISILSEVRHPNIIKIIRAFDPPSPKGRCRFVVMSLARGPDIGTLLELGGALSLPLARLFARHLIAAVSYLHGRAVLHRDIKPDNCILVLDTKNKGPYSPDKSYIGDDSIWKGGDQVAQKVVDSGKWKVVLVDFGFARALSPTEVHQVKNKMRNSIVNESKPLGRMISKASFRMSKDEEMKEIEETAKLCSKPLERLPTFHEDEEAGALTPSPAPKRRSTGGKRSSVARMPVKAMSALGSKFYAAPEVEKQVRAKKAADKNSGSHEALTECVADYGMISDAYSIGVSLREVLTGVPPTSNVAQYINENSNPVANLITGLCCKSSGRRVCKFRYLDEIPKDAALLIGKMTKLKQDERLTVREAQMHPYICGSENEAEYELPQGDYPSNHGDPIVYLESATN